MSLPILPDAALDQLFRNARTQNAWQDKPVSEDQLHAIYELMKWGPTSANSTPARIVFLTSAAAKRKLEPALDEGNRAKTMKAPVTAILGIDYAFHEKLPYLFPHTDAKSWFEGDDAKIAVNAVRNATLQGAYFIMAARAIGLDCGPMSGFNYPMVDAAFFAGTSIRANFICALGHGDPDPRVLFPRAPRLPFDEACRIE